MWARSGVGNTLSETPHRHTRHSNRIHYVFSKPTPLTRQVPIFTSHTTRVQNRIHRMPLHSDLTIDASKFKPEAVSQSTRQMNEGVMQLTKGNAGWWEVCTSFLILVKNGIDDYVDRRSEIQRIEKVREDCSSQTRLSRVRGDFLGAIQRGRQRYSVSRP